MIRRENFGRNPAVLCDIFVLEVAAALDVVQFVDQNIVQKTNKWSHKVTIL